MPDECQTYGCDRDAEVKVEPRYGVVPKPKKRCRPCLRAWKSGNSVTAGANVRVSEL